MLLLKKNNLLPTLEHYLPKNPCIIEAGAFDGCDTIKVAQFFPHATIHSFEPVPEIFAMLKRNTTPFKNIHCHPLALSSANGTEQFYVSEKPNSPGEPFRAGSLKKPHKRLEYSFIHYPKTITVPTITLDTWAEKNNISQIDLLWLDVQGHALDILQASPITLSNLKMLYVEVEFEQAYKNQATYTEIKAWLIKQGFAEIGRDFKDKPHWFFANVLFIKKT